MIGIGAVREMAGTVTVTDEEEEMSRGKGTARAMCYPRRLRNVM